MAKAAAPSEIERIRCAARNASRLLDDALRLYKAKGSPASVFLLTAIGYEELAKAAYVMSGARVPPGGGKHGQKFHFVSAMDMLFRGLQHGLLRNLMPILLEEAEAGTPEGRAVRDSIFPNALSFIERAAVKDSPEDRAIRRRLEQAKRIMNLRFDAQYSEKQNGALSDPSAFDPEIAREFLAASRLVGMMFEYLETVTDAEVALVRNEMKAKGLDVNTLARGSFARDATNGKNP